MEKRKKTLLILGLCIFTLALIGLSYAFWQITLQQTDENVVYTDCLKLDFTDENAISLQNAYPMTYEEQEAFFASETPYHFTIKNECNSKANLSINIETLPIEGENKLDDEWVDVILYEGNEDYIMYETPVLNTPEYDEEYNEHYKVTANSKNDNKLLENSIDAYNLYNFTIEKNETKDFNMYLFLDEETPVETESGKKTTNAHWKGKVTINATYKVPQKRMLRKMDYDDSNGMWEHKLQVTDVVFENTLTPHEEDNVLSFDESVDQDGSVMSYLVPNGKTTKGRFEYDGYTAYIQADGGVIANPDSSYLFIDFGNVETITGLENLDTSQVTNMSYMFSAAFVESFYFSCLESLDVSSLDTSQVTDMNGMFSDMDNLTTLNLGEQFNTSKVTNMSRMFHNLKKITSLNLGNQFDTSQVTDMSYMFHDMNNLSSLDLGSNFDTSNVTNMEDMFASMTDLTSLNLGEHFDTSNVTSMRYMFSGNTELNQVDYGDYFVHKEGANTDLMFDGCPEALNKPTDESWSKEEWYNPS